MTKKNKKPTALVISQKEHDSYKHSDVWQYSEQWMVTFWFRDGRFWKQKEDFYYTIDKGDFHDDVESKWKEEFKQFDVELISVKYC